jgi:serine phosphatase RsbU (regulator of sigma subunit)/PAS domain-containing protein/anti-sigma regulatory factor (Ser/Thr protein kinase)
LFAQYAHFIDRSPGAALLWTRARGIVHANERAAAWIDDLVQCETLTAGAAECAKSRRAVVRRALATSFLFVPLIEANDQAGFVLGIEGRDFDDVPALLHAVHENARHFSQIVHRLPQVVLTARPDGAFDYASHRWYQVTGSRPDEMDVGSSLRQATGRYDGSFNAMWISGVSSAGEFSFEIRLKTVRGTRWHELRAVPSYMNGHLRKWIITLDDIQDRIETRAELARARARLEALADIGAMLLDVALPAEDLVRRAIAAGARVLEGIWIASFELDGRKSVVALPNDARMFERALEGGGALGASATMQQWNTELPRPVLRIPLRFGVEGAHRLAVVGSPGAEPFKDQDVRLFSEVASRIGLALRNAVAYSREARIARVLQTSMLPVALPQPSGLTFDVAYFPAQTEALVGGDWYDAFDLADGRVAISIGDVAGHGLEAAVVMGHVRENIRNGAKQGLSVAEVLAETNRAVVAGGSGLVTAFLAYLDPLTLSLEYASAGHLPPVVVDSDGTLVELELGEMILGAVSNAQYQTRTYALEEGAALVLYTDGLVENARDAVVGETALRRVLTDWGRRGFEGSALEISKRTLAGARPNDDIAILVVRTAPLARIDVALPGSASSARRARIAIDRILSKAPFGDRSEEFALAACEAVNNAIEHGCNSPLDQIRFSLEWDVRGAEATVESSGAWQDRQPSAERGRGIVLMRALADDVVINAGKHGTTVRLSLDTLAQSLVNSPA